VVVHGEADLVQVVGAADAGGGLADLLDGGQEQTDQDGDDGDDDEQFNQREAAEMTVPRSPPEKRRKSYSRVKLKTLRPEAVTSALSVVFSLYFLGIRSLNCLAPGSPGISSLWTLAPVRS